MVAVYLMGCTRSGLCSLTLLALLSTCRCSDTQGAATANAITSTGATMNGVGGTLGGASGTAGSAGKPGGNGGAPAGTGSAGMGSAGAAANASGGSGGMHSAGQSGAGSTANGSTANGGTATGGTATGGTSTGGSATGGKPTGGSGGGSSGSAGAPPLGKTSYSTNFDLTESPISEKGAWKNSGLDWTLVETGNGNAYGTQTGDGSFTDSYAYLSGFPANQRASGVVHRAPNIDGSCTHEVEILLRWSDAAHDARGYECNLAFDGQYTEIVRWNGKLGSFDYLAHTGVPGGVHDGDTLSASIVGNLIVVTLNGVEINRATDNTFSSGNPGIAFWRGAACGTKGDYGFTQFTASSIDP